MNAANILIALDVVDKLLARAAAWNTAVRDANQEGRDLTDTEVDSLRELDDLADDKLAEAIDAARQREANQAT